MFQLLPPQKLVVFLLFNLLICTTTIAQVGINTTTPANGAILDVESADKGALLPRLNIADLSTIAPVTGGGTEGLLAYNTNTTTGPGYVFWDGSQWVSITAVDDDWKLAGNAGTNPSNNFLGTTDTQALRFRTSNTEALEISGGNATNRGKLRAMTDGTAALPVYSYNNDPDTGIYRSGVNNLSITTGGAERLSVESNGQLRNHSNGTNGTPAYSFESDTNTGLYRGGDDDLHITAGGREMASFQENGNNSEVVINDGSEQTNFRVEGDTQANLLFTDAADDRVGINTNNPQEELHIAGAGSTVRIEGLNSTNNAFNNGTDNSVVLVDANGNLVLQDRVDDFPVDASDATTFFAAPIIVQNALGTVLSTVAHAETFTLTRETLIEVSFWTAVSISRFGGTLPTDGKPRLYGGYVTDGTSDIVYNSSSWTNGIMYNDLYTNTGDVTTGFFTIGGNGFITLPAGTHTIQLIIFAGGGSAVTDDGTGFPRAAEGYQITFGANAFNRFQIVYHN